MDVAADNEDGLSMDDDDDADSCRLIMLLSLWWPLSTARAGRSLGWLIFPAWSVFYTFLALNKNKFGGGIIE